MANEDTRAGEWAQQSARWLRGPCHRSLYSYQMRTALALAIENPHLAVTFMGLTMPETLVRSEPLPLPVLLPPRLPSSGR